MVCQRHRAALTTSCGTVIVSARRQIEKSPPSLPVGGAHRGGVVLRCPHHSLLDKEVLNTNV
jgi:hypothetical protein